MCTHAIQDSLGKADNLDHGETKFYFEKDGNCFAIYTKIDGARVYIRPLPHGAEPQFSLPADQPRSNVVLGIKFPADLDIKPKYVWKLSIVDKPKQ